MSLDSEITHYNDPPHLDAVMRLTAESDGESELVGGAGDD